ncbi:MAG: methyltransferase domain-containing protein [Chloroflexi bacterium]|nr:methyltransferase domain-containing protein [Chloroflexota bacterium]
MSTKPLFQDKSYLREQQYRTSRNLEARVALHRDFSTNPYDWQMWVFDQLALEPGTAVLECGCGPGWLWRHNLDRIPAGCAITLTDLSPGMVAEAQSAVAEAEAAFAGRPGFHFQTASIEDLPFADASFDVVVANHMLYHVPDLPQALREVRRVLKANGRFFAATNGDSHMRELRELARQFAPGLLNTWPQLAFRLENGRALLAATFDTVDLVLYADGLRVTAVAPLLAYLHSMSLAQLITPEDAAALEQHLQEMITARGAYHIQKETGLFIAHQGAV